MVAVAEETSQLSSTPHLTFCTALPAPAVRARTRRTVVFCNDSPLHFGLLVVHSRRYDEDGLLVLSAMAEQPGTTGTGLEQRLRSCGSD
jgi:hypothetical protein